MAPNLLSNFSSVDVFCHDFEDTCLGGKLMLRLILRFCRVPEFSSEPYFQTKMKINGFFQFLKGIGKNNSTNLIGKKNFCYHFSTNFLQFDQNL